MINIDWSSVDEILPDDDTQVLLYSSLNNGHWVGYRSGAEWRIDTGRGIYDPIIETRVTHWRHTDYLYE